MNNNAPIFASIAKSCDTSEMEVQFLTENDRAYIATLSAQKRVRELSIWRSLLRKTLCEAGFGKEVYRADISYNEVGAPCIKGVNFSVSHSRTVVAILIDPEKVCAVDIEELDRDFDTVASRFATDAERAIADSLPLIWSAKECAYKLSGRNNLDFIKDIVVTNINVEGEKKDRDSNESLSSYLLLLLQRLAEPHYCGIVGF